MTRGGSFCCSNIQTFAKQMTPYHQTRYRGVCLKKGFKSLAIVPIQYREKIFAIIHLADERESVVTPNKVQFIETFAPLIGEAIHRFNAEAELARHRDHLEELVKQRTLELRQAADELARSNRDLEQFAYVASHDLQEPLRAVSGFMDLLLHNYGGELSGKALEYIEEASEGARRMQTLIEDLLKYSRVGTQGVVFEAVDANEALREAVAILTFAIRESNAIVTNDPLPVVWADATQLTQVFQNLIGNAIRFRGPQKPEVHISAKMVPNRKSVVGSPSTAGEDTGAKGGLESHDITGDPTFNASDETGHPRVNAKAWLFAVHDNGIGIEPRYHERIFMLFQRLHSRTQYPGTGIGLAVCKRIVERHGGNIWVQSQPGRGTTFYFTIPTQEG
jgi:light-regulated signal transduction histidine kinase (bacteriophytochrome)